MNYETPRQPLSFSEVTSCALGIPRATPGATCCLVAAACASHTVPTALKRKRNHWDFSRQFLRVLRDEKNQHWASQASKKGSVGNDAFIQPLGVTSSDFQKKKTGRSTDPKRTSFVEAMRNLADSTTYRT